MARFLFLGELVGRCGIAALKTGLSRIKTEYNIDYTIINAEGMTNGFGLGRQHSALLGKIGIDLSTGGEKIFYKPDMVEFFPKCSYVLRPYNYPPMSPGRGVKNLKIGDRDHIVLNLMGQAGMKASIQNPFVAVDSFLKKIEGNPVILVQFHASTTAEKATMLHFLDGRVAAVIGTHTKIMSADSRVTAKGTAFISDNGRVGSFMSVGGFQPETEIGKFRSQIPVRSREAWDDARIQGVVVDINEITGMADSITVVDRSISVKVPQEDS